MDIWIYPVKGHIHYPNNQVVNHIEAKANFT